MSDGNYFQVMCCPRYVVPQRSQRQLGSQVCGCRTSSPVLLLPRLWWGGLWSRWRSWSFWGTLGAIVFIKKEEEKASLDHSAMWNVETVKWFLKTAADEKASTLRLVSRMWALWSRTGPHARTSPVLGLKLCCHRCEILFSFICSF